VVRTRITTGKRRIKVRPETLEGAERDRAWQEITSLAPGYGRYLEITDGVIFRSKRGLGRPGATRKRRA
jgi:hypothetical protein